ncbi:hypothetical protein DUNSADRAFT_2712 [Dunaliella salina]|uniref:Phosphodiesterase n=1 Tax=Dunaliella salina TaxID=3046 RepID=A0ABQ7GV79_DUNSA|nr:hypothetical protein DUNSADRAFT_2712 [Dunaliella salina]|eukprot:KAF5838514.1 hypothetical protein DUNSADRAFT_2712 [Dunaliella salina]
MNQCPASVDVLLKRAMLWSQVMRDQLRNKPYGAFLAAVVLAVSLNTLMALAIHTSFSGYVMLILMGISSSFAYALGRKAIPSHTGSKQAIIPCGQEPVVHDGALQRLLHGVMKFKTTMQAIAEGRHVPGGLLLHILDTYLEGKEPEEEELVDQLSRSFHQFSIFYEATQPLDLTGNVKMEADVQEALLSLLGRCALCNSQTKEVSGLDPQGLLHEVTPGLLPFDHSTVGTDKSLGTSCRRSCQDETAGETDEDLPSLPTMLAKLASAGASEYWQTSRYSTEGSLWLQPSLQSALHVLQGSRLPSKKMSATNLGNRTGYGQPGSSSSPALPLLHQAPTSFPSLPLHMEGKEGAASSSSVTPVASNIRMESCATPTVASAGAIDGSRPAINMALSSSCNREDTAVSKSMGSTPLEASNLPKESLDWLKEAVLHAKLRLCSLIAPNMQALPSAASAELRGKIPSSRANPSHAIKHSQSQTYSSHFESAAENSGIWVRSSPACVQGTQVLGEEQEQYFSGKEACGKERSPVNKQDSQGGTLKTAASMPGPIPSPFGLEQLMESQGSKEGKDIGSHEENKPRCVDPDCEKAEQTDQERESQEQRDSELHEAGRVAHPEGPLVLEMEVALENAYSSFSFDAFHLNEVTQGHPLSTLSYFLFHKSGLISSFKLNASKLGRFLQTIEAGYSPLNPYHNAVHATDVLQTLHVILHHGWQNLHQSDPMLHLAGYLAAIVHDFEHGGYTNDFLKNTHSRLAIRYNDTAPLENHHVAAAFDVLFTPGHNFLCNLPIYDYTRLRKAVIDLVLATDMKQHFHFVSLGKGIVQQPRNWRGPTSLQPHNFLSRRRASKRSSCSRILTPQSMSSLVQRASVTGMHGPSSMPDCTDSSHKLVEAETIRKKRSVPEDSIRWSGRSSSDGSSPSSPWKGLVAQISAPPALWEKEGCWVHVAADPEKRLLLLQIALKCADLGHIAEDLDVHIRWVKLLEEEFWRQGDQEKAANLPLSPLFDRTKPGISKSQVGFFDVVALPLLQILVSAMPGALPMLTGAEHNYDHWKHKEQHKQAQQQMQKEEAT